MKIQQKIKVLTAATAIFAVLAISLFTAAGAIIITGNTLNFNPVDKPTCLLSSNCTSTPYVGDTIELTAAITPTTAQGSVTFWINGRSAATVATVNGLATYDYKIPDKTALAIYPTATLT